LAFLYIIQHLNDLMLNFMVSTTNFWYAWGWQRFRNKDETVSERDGKC
jgi:hypothetical protein